MDTLTTFTQDNPNLVRTLGFVAVATIAGGIGGLVLSKAMLTTKGTSLAHAVLTAKGGGTAIVPSFVNHVNQTIAKGLSFSDPIMTVWNTITRNALPLTTGAVGGGVATQQVMKRQVRTVEDALSKQVAQTEAAQTEAARLQSELIGAETGLKDLQARLDAPPKERPPSRNPLEQIQGIGRIFAQRLNTAGIYTFSDLAAQTPDAVRDIIGPTRGSAMAEPEAWIAEAQQLANAS